MKILAIDTSCDDTSVAISDGLNILANVFWSKMKLHSDWGGVVPIEAKRQHEQFLDPAIQECLKQANLKLEQIDYIAITYGPGLAIALEAGITKAKELSKTYNKKIVAVNHMIGHVYSVLARDNEGNPISDLHDFEFPLLALTISGGHTDMYLMTDHLKFQNIGQTLDDSVGEAIDKVGRMLGMGFPAGAKIEESAKKGDASKFKFPRPLSDSMDLNWSFSGLKTAVLYQVRKIVGDYSHKPQKGDFKLEDASDMLDENTIYDISASFQQAAIDSLLIKVEKALKNHKPKMLVVGGGVIANKTLRDQLDTLTKKYSTPLFFPKPIWLCTDNASMIAVAGYFYAKENRFVKNLDELDRVPALTI